MATVLHAYVPDLPDAPGDHVTPSRYGENHLVTLVDADIPDTVARVADVAAGYQPLDADLTAIAGTATQAYGRALLALADVAALRAALDPGWAAAREHTASGLPEANYSTVGPLDRVTHTGAAGAYGARLNYTQQGAQSSGFSIAQGIIAVFDGTDGGQGLASWLVASTPTDADAAFGVFGQEVNPINLAADMGYSKRRGALVRWTGGIQVVPESRDLTHGGPAVGRNTTYGFCTAPSNEVNDQGLHAKTYNGLLVERDSIGPGGRGILASGDTSGDPEQLPAYALEVDQAWEAGLWMADATFADDAIVLAPDHRVRFGPAGPMVCSGAGTPEGSVAAPVGSMYARTDGGAGTTLYVKETGAGDTGWAAK